MWACVDISCVVCLVGYAAVRVRGGRVILVCFPPLARGYKRRPADESPLFPSPPHPRTNPLFVLHPADTTDILLSPAHSHTTMTMHASTPSTEDATHVKLEDIIHVDMLCDTREAFPTKAELMPLRIFLLSLFSDPSPTLPEFPASPPSMLSESPAALPPTLPESPVTPPPTLPDSSATPPPTRPDSPVASSSTQGSFPLLPDAGKGKTSAKRKRDEDAAVGSMSGHSFCHKRVKLRASGLHECTWPDCQVRGLRSKDMWAHVMTHEPGLRHEPPAAAQVRCLWAGCSVEPGTPDVIGSHMKTAHGVVDARGKQDSKAACQCPDPQCKEKTQSRHGQSWKGWQVQWAEYQRHCESTHWLCGKDVAFCEICGGRPRTTAWEDPKRRMFEKCLEALLHRESFKKGDRAKLLDEKREEEEWNTARPQYRA